MGETNGIPENKSEVHPRALTIKSENIIGREFVYFTTGNVPQIKVCCYAL